MGRRGPVSEPTALKLIRGNPGRRALNRREPKPEPGSVAIPETLRGEPARRLWLELAPQLRKIGLLGRIDRDHLARACRLEALGLKLLAKAEKAPIATTKANGRQPSADLTGALRLFEAADRVWFRFGITPSERTRLTTATGGDPAREPARDPFEAYRRRKAAHRAPGR